MDSNPIIKELEGLEEKDLEEPRKSRFGKFIVQFTALFLLLIVVVYYLPGDVIPILEGRTESSKMSNNLAVDFDGGKVIFDEAAYRDLKKLYLENQEIEIKVCLKGNRQGSTYYVTDLDIPTSFSQSVFHVTSESCSSDTLIPLHTHPYKHCIFSEQDIKSYEQFIERNPESIGGLMCEIDRFNFYKG